MTAAQVLSLIIANRALAFIDENQWNCKPFTEITLDNIDEFEDGEICMYVEDAISDAASEVREGKVETDIPCDGSRYFESKSVAACFDGRWIGWTYWYGGGKHAQPETVEWVCEAYFLDCVEEVQTVTVRKFTKQGSK